MFTMIAAAALAAATAPAAPNADAQAPKAQTGQMSGIDHSKMDHSKMSGMDMSKMDHSKMSSCCKKDAAGKMECSMPDKAGAASGHQGHSGQ